MNRSRTISPHAVNLLILADYGRTKGKDRWKKRNILILLPSHELWLDCVAIRCHQRNAFG